MLVVLGAIRVQYNITMSTRLDVDGEDRHSSVWLNDETPVESNFHERANEPTKTADDTSFIEA